MVDIKALLKEVKDSYEKVTSTALSAYRSNLAIILNLVEEEKRRRASADDAWYEVDRLDKVSGHLFEMLRLLYHQNNLSDLLLSEVVSIEALLDEIESVK